MRLCALTLILRSQNRPFSQKSAPWYETLTSNSHTVAGQACRKAFEGACGPARCEENVRVCKGSKFSIMSGSVVSVKFIYNFAPDFDRRP